MLRHDALHPFESCLPHFMLKRIGSAARVFGLLLHGEFERFRVTLLHQFLPWYYRAWRRIFGRDPKPRNAEGIARDPIMIYQMAKVGSRSVLFSLEYSYARHALPGVPIYHIHNLVDLDAHEERTRRMGDREELEMVRHYKQVRRDFDGLPNQHWNVISLVRDPVARNVGAFFHNLDHYIPNWKIFWKEGSLTTAEIMQVILQDEQVHHTANVWFDVEFKSVLGIDVYEAPFNAADGYQFYTNPPKVDLVIIRLEDLNRVAVPVVQKFLGIRDFKLYPSNIGDEKDYAEVYRAFKATPLPLDYVQRTYQSRFAHHFYTEAEIAAFTKKWTRLTRPRSR